MAAASTQFTIDIGQVFHAAAETDGVTTRALNLSEPDNSGDCEVIFLESTVLTKEQALLLVDAVRQNIQEGIWPRG